MYVKIEIQERIKKAFHKFTCLRQESVSKLLALSTYIFDFEPDIFNFEK